MRTTWISVTSLAVLAVSGVAPAQSWSSTASTSTRSALYGSPSLASGKVAASENAGIHTEPSRTASARTFNPSGDLALPPTAAPSVRFLYVRPTDRPFRQDFADAVRATAFDLQSWYHGQLGRTFSFSTSQVVENCSLPHAHSYYGDDTWSKVMTDVQSCAPVAHYSQQFVWVLYVDVIHACGAPGRLGAGAAGVTMLPRQDMDGLIGAPYFDDCGTQHFQPVSRYVGGAGHELGHALGLNHPPGCDDGLPSCDSSALMWAGYAAYPNTYLRADDKQILLASPFIADTTPPQTTTSSDFDADDRTDIAVWRPSDGTWYVQPNTGGSTTFGFGQQGDLPVDADFSGDGRTDYAVFRPSNGTWYVQSSSGFSAVSWGLAGDVPVPADYDRDGRDDIAVWRPSNGSSSYSVRFGATDDRPVVGDYDGDGRADLAVFRPGTASWIVRRSSDGQEVSTQFGLMKDRVVPADYDGDGKTDIAVFRPTNGSWRILHSSDGTQRVVRLGSQISLTATGDYDGDGWADFAVFSAGSWQILHNTGGTIAVTFGAAGDVPIPGVNAR